MVAVEFLGPTSSAALIRPTLWLGVAGRLQCRSSTSSMFYDLRYGLQGNVVQ